MNCTILKALVKKILTRALLYWKVICLYPLFEKEEKHILGKHGCPIFKFHIATHSYIEDHFVCSGSRLLHV